MVEVVVVVADDEIDDDDDEVETLSLAILFFLIDKYHHTDKNNIKTTPEMTEAMMAMVAPRDNFLDGTSTDAKGHFKDEFTGKLELEIMHD